MEPIIDQTRWIYRFIDRQIFIYIYIQIHRDRSDRQIVKCIDRQIEKCIDRQINRLYLYHFVIYFLEENRFMFNVGKTKKKKLYHKKDYI